MKTIINFFLKKKFKFFFEFELYDLRLLSEKFTLFINFLLY